MGTQQGTCITFVCDPLRDQQAVDQVTVAEEVEAFARQDWGDVRDRAAPGQPSTVEGFSLEWLEVARARDTVVVGWTTPGSGPERVVDALLSTVEARCPVVVAFVTENNLGDAVLLEPATEAGTTSVERLADGTGTGADAATGYGQTDSVDNLDTWVGADLLIGVYFREQYGYEVATRRGLAASTFVDVTREAVEGHYPGRT